MFRVLVLGAAAGGGFPQWNCNCENCRAARAGVPGVQPRTQSSLAVSADGERWAILNASPDIRQQILDNPQLHPRTGARHSPISSVVLTNADVDHSAGLLTLRERQPFNLYATTRVHSVLESSLIFEVMNRSDVRRTALTLGKEINLQDASGSDLGLTLHPFAIPGKVALYLENPDAGDNFGSVPEDTIGLRVSTADQAKDFYYLPGCAAMPDDLKQRLQDSDLVFMDGTTWTDNEMSNQGMGFKTARRMGHMAMSGPGGTIQEFEDLNIRHKVFIHINNTNPVLREDSEEHRQAVAAGWTIATDGLELKL